MIYLKHIETLTHRGALQADIEDSHAGLDALVDLCHGLSKTSGWWQNSDGSPINPGDPLVFASKIALIHSELSEALEAGRKSKHDDHLTHRSGVEVELVDAIIRICDLAGALDLDLSGALIEKLAYNAQRPDHQLSNRAQPDGKKF